MVRPLLFRHVVPEFVNMNVPDRRIGDPDCHVSLIPVICLIAHRILRLVCRNQLAGDAGNVGGNGEGNHGNACLSAPFRIVPVINNQFFEPGSIMLQAFAGLPGRIPGQFTDTVFPELRLSVPGPVHRLGPAGSGPFPGRILQRNGQRFAVIHADLPPVRVRIQFLHNKDRLLRRHFLSVGVNLPVLFDQE